MVICILLAMNGDDVRATKVFLGDNSVDDPRLVVLSVRRVPEGLNGYNVMERVDDIWVVGEQVVQVQRRIRAGGTYLSTFSILHHISQRSITDTVTTRGIPDESVFDVDHTGYYQSLADGFDAKIESPTGSSESDDGNLF